MTKNTTEKIKSVGEHVLDLQAVDAPQATADELQAEIHSGTKSKKSYQEEVYTTLAQAQKDDTITGQFFIVVLQKKERHLKNVMRSFFFYRQSCPTPTCDQTVYKCTKGSDNIDFLWAIPDAATCQWMPLQKSQLTSEEMWLYSMVDAFNKGALDKICQQLNKEVIQ